MKMKDKTGRRRNSLKGMYLLIITLDTLEPFYIRLIDMGASNTSEIKCAGSIRDSWKLYEHIKSFLFPLFTGRKTKFADWFQFGLYDTEDCTALGVNKLIGVQRDRKIHVISPAQLADDFFRLICVQTFTLRIISKDSTEKLRPFI